MCSSPVRRISSRKQTSSLCSLLKLTQSSVNLPFLSSSFCTSRPASALKASKTEAAKAESEGNEEEEKYEEYEAEIVKPYGLKFAKCRDGGTYIDAIAPGGSADKTGAFTVGERVISTRDGIGKPTRRE